MLFICNPNKSDTNIFPFTPSISIIHNLLTFFVCIIRRFMLSYITPHGTYTNPCYIYALEWETYLISLLFLWLLLTHKFMRRWSLTTFSMINFLPPKQIVLMIFFSEIEMSRNKIIILYYFAASCFKGCSDGVMNIILNICLATGSYLLAGYG